MWELDSKESWVLKNWWFWTGIGEDWRVPWTARRSNQSILEEISPEYSLEGLMLRLELQYFGYLMRRTDSLEKTVMLGKIESGEEKGMTENEMIGWHHWLNGHEFEQVVEMVKDREARRAAVHGVTKGLTQVSNWTTIFLNKIVEITWFIILELHAVFLLVC